MDIFINILALVNTSIFVTLSIIHLYWAFGGKRGSQAVIPQTLDGQPTMNPGALITIVVGLGLLLLAVTTVNMFFFWINMYYYKIGMWAIALIFYLRAVGDFKQVGFTKKIKGTLFAEYDTKYYSPLSLYLGTSSLLIILFQNA